MTWICRGLRTGHRHSYIMTDGRGVGSVNPGRANLSRRLLRLQWALHVTSVLIEVAGLSLAGST
jgi:hypothetical protein